MDGILNGFFRGPGIILPVLIHAHAHFNHKSSHVFLSPLHSFPSPYQKITGKSSSIPFNYSLPFSFPF